MNFFWNFLQNTAHAFSLKHSFQTTMYIQRDAETLYGFHRNTQPKMYMHRKCESTELDFVGLWNALETW